MFTEWRITQKPDFFKSLLTLPPKEMHQVLEKIELLAQDPTPDAKTKKQLKYMNGRLHRIRCGDYRIFYTFEEPYISILALRRRDDDTYDEDLDVEFLGGLDPELHATVSTAHMHPDWEKFVTPRKRSLPEPITQELLTTLRIPKECHARLLLITTEDDLLECPGIPEEYLLLIDEYMFERPLVQVLQQPDYLLNDVKDLLRYKEGELLAFLLKLSPEQEKYVNWGINGTGPTLLKGGPGTGKSTIALYRIRSLVRELRKERRNDIRILFTTYTNALIKVAEQLLQQLLGDDARFVEVQTADKIVMRILSRAGAIAKFVDDNRLTNLIQQAIAQASFTGNPLQQAAQCQAIEQISIEYLHQEITQVIMARQIYSLSVYQSTPRPGRKVRLTPIQRQAIWSIHEKLKQILDQRGEQTWQQARAKAESLVAGGMIPTRYDAVLIDEAQDLDPSTLRLLVRLCDKPHRLFITADANQSIYGSGFNWSDVHERLKFQGHTSILRTNYRSTSEIGEAARSYLAAGILDTDCADRGYVHSGPKPGLRIIDSSAEEVQLLARFLPAAAHEIRLNIGACAILCPTTKAGQTLAAELTHHGIEATFMSSQDLNLSRPGVKVLTLKSAKGLEFPIVALAGFSNSGWFSSVPTSIPADEREEFLAVDRRTLFVGMTRAMRVLLVTIPAQAKSPLLEGFDARYWNLIETIK